jgi:hypothetical protein
VIETDVVNLMSRKQLVIFVVLLSDAWAHLMYVEE